MNKQLMKNQQHFALLIFYIAKLFIAINFCGIKITVILSHLNSRDIEVIVLSSDYTVQTFELKLKVHSLDNNSIICESLAGFRKKPLFSKPKTTNLTFKLKTTSPSHC